MFGLVADNALHLKADKQTADRFMKQGLEPFEFDKKGKIIQLSYYKASNKIFDNQELAKKWAELAFDASLR